MPVINTIIFDLGGVLIDWNPEYVYRHIFPDEEQRQWFFQNICTSDWNEEQDAGKSLLLATEEKVKEFPEWEKEIREYYGRWEEMLGGPIDGTVELFRQLRNNTPHRIYALTNWSAETFPVALQKFDFLHWFDGRVVSGEEKTRKPFPEFYERLTERYQVNPELALYIDDNQRNLVPAAEMGMTTIHFHGPEQFKSELIRLKLL